jgi:hypothetical protein
MQLVCAVNYVTVISYTIITVFLYRETKVPVYTGYMPYLQKTKEDTYATYTAFYTQSQDSISLSRSVLAF